jgi:hypothetical protein
MSPTHVGDCSFWQFFAAVEGWRVANSPPEGPKPPSADDHDRMMAQFAG